MVPSIKGSYLHSLLFVVFIYLASIVMASLTTDYQEGIYVGADPQTFFGWMWYAIFSLVGFVTTWGPILFIVVVGGGLDIVFKLGTDLWNQVPIFPYIPYPGFQFENSIDTIKYINEQFFDEFFLLLGEQLVAIPVDFIFGGGGGGDRVQVILRWLRILRRVFV